MSGQYSNHGLSIEIGMQLSVKLCNINKSVSCELLGARHGKYLILRALEDDHPDELHRVGESITVKYNCAGYIFDFSSRVIQVFTSPEKLIFVESQNVVVENGSKRARERIDCFVRVQLSSGETVFNATVANISTLGCLCLFDKENNFDICLERHPRIIVRFSSGISIDGEVRFLKRNFLHSHHIGISFNEIDNEDKKKLTELIPSLRF